MRVNHVQELCRFRYDHDDLHLKDTAVVRRSEGIFGIRTLGEYRAPFLVEQFLTTGVYLQGSANNFMVFRPLVPSRNNEIKVLPGKL